MPKLKTKKSAQKRMRVTGSGHIKVKRAKMRHNLTLKSRKSKKRLRHSGIMEESRIIHVRRLLPTFF